MLTTVIPASVPSLAEGRQLAARYFGEERYGLPPHLVRAARSGDHGLVLHVRDGYAFLAYEALGQNILLFTKCPANQPGIVPGVYALVTDNGLAPYEINSAPLPLRDHIADALASYRLMTRPAPAVREMQEDDSTEHPTPVNVGTVHPATALLSTDDLDAIAAYTPADDTQQLPESTPATIEESQDEAKPAAVDPRIAVALSPEHAVALLSREYPDQDHAATLTAIQQGREAVDVLNHRVMLDYSPSQQRFIGILHPDDKAVLDDTLSTSAPASATTQDAQEASLLPGRPGREIEPEHPGL